MLGAVQRTAEEGERGAPVAVGGSEGGESASAGHVGFEAYGMCCEDGRVAGGPVHSIDEGAR